MISICILNWNCLEVLRQTLALLADDLRHIEHEIFVYDQNSSDGSREFLESQSGPTIFLSKRNVGNSISRNTMISNCKHKYVLLLDSDIIPIKGSIAKMIDFMEINNEYCYLGYDYKSHSLDHGSCTPCEGTIEKKDVTDWRDIVALTQYGVFRRSIFETLKFPEFYPFDRAGWGAEDNILGFVIKELNMGIGGTIFGRVYYHKKGSSITLLGQDEHRMSYMKRITHFIYFIELLTVEQRLFSLKSGTLPSIRLPCNKYFWGVQSNLGDVATDYVLSLCFPFLEFDITNQENLLMFGGTIFDHIRNANKRCGANFKNVLYFGVGVGKQSEIDSAKKMLEDGVRFTIIPRGGKTKTELTNSGFNCETPCGDVLQLFSALPVAETKEGSPELEVYDIWKNEFLDLPAEHLTIRVADKRTLKELPFYNLRQFLALLNNVSKVHSYQIHPTLISCLLGKPARFYPKDWRVEDFYYFKSFNLEMNNEQAMQLRSDAQKNIIRFTKSFLENLRSSFL